MKKAFTSLLVITALLIGISTLAHSQTTLPAPVPAAPLAPPVLQPAPAVPAPPEVKPAPPMAIDVPPYPRIKDPLKFSNNGGDYSSQHGGMLHFDYEYQMGPYIRRANGTIEDPQGFWLALRPLQPPPGARGGYGLLGDDRLLGQAPGFGLRQLGRIARHFITFDSLYVVQPPGFSDIGVQEGVFTSAEELNDITLGWVFFDLRPKFEADLIQRLQINP